MAATTSAASAGIRQGRSARRSSLGAHSMLYSDTPLAFKRAMFGAAAAMGASEIRVDLDLTAVYLAPGAAPDFTTVDQYMTLAAQYHLRVLADVTAMPYWLAQCQTPADAAASWACGTDRPQAFADLVGAVARHARGAIDDYELINEPDAPSTWSGTPAEYAWMLADTDRAVHAADPSARVAIGGVTGAPSARAWLARVFGTPGANAAHSFDIANVHLRDRASRLGADLRSWTRFYARYGFTRALWVTEHGYPSDPAYQYDPAFRGADAAGGLAAQARFLAVSVPRLVAAGAARVFVSERDNLGGAFASEGVLAGQVSDPVAAESEYRVVAKPAVSVLRALASGLDAAAVNHPRLAADGRRRG